MVYDFGMMKVSRVEVVNEFFVFCFCCFEICGVNDVCERVFDFFVQIGGVVLQFFQIFFGFFYFVLLNVVLGRFRSQEGVDCNWNWLYLLQCKWQFLCLIVVYSECGMYSV